MSINHSVECPLTNKDTTILAGTVSARGAYSSGVFMTTWRRLLSGGGWTEVLLFNLLRNFIQIQTVYSRTSVLEHLWDHNNMFKTGVVRPNEC